MCTVYFSASETKKSQSQNLTNLTDSPLNIQFYYEFKIVP